MLMTIIHNFNLKNMSHPKKFKMCFYLISLITILICVNMIVLLNVAVLYSLFISDIHHNKADPLFLTVQLHAGHLLHIKADVQQIYR